MARDNSWRFTLTLIFDFYLLMVLRDFAGGDYVVTPRSQTFDGTRSNPNSTL